MLLLPATFYSDHPFEQGLVVAGRPQEAAAVVKLPKALLQQHCQKLGWAPPRFDKLPLGGGRLPTAALRYSVTLEPAPQGKVLLRNSSPSPCPQLKLGITSIPMINFGFACAKHVCMSVCMVCCLIGVRPYDAYIGNYVCQLRISITHVLYTCHLHMSALGGQAASSLHSTTYCSSRCVKSAEVAWLAIAMNDAAMWCKLVQLCWWVL